MSRTSIAHRFIFQSCKQVQSGGRQGLVWLLHYNQEPRCHLSFGFTTLSMCLPGFNVCLMFKVVSRLSHHIWAERNGSWRQREDVSQLSQPTLSLPGNLTHNLYLCIGHPLTAKEAGNVVLVRPLAPSNREVPLLGKKGRWCASNRHLLYWRKKYTQNKNSGRK